MFIHSILIPHHLFLLFGQQIMIDKSQQKKNARRGYKGQDSDGVFTFDAIINFSATGRVQFGRYGLKLNGRQSRIGKTTRTRKTITTISVDLISGWLIALEKQTIVEKIY